MNLEFKLEFDSNTIEGQAQHYYVVPILDDDNHEYSWIHIKDKNDNVIMEITTDEFCELASKLERLIDFLRTFEAKATEAKQ